MQGRGKGVGVSDFQNMKKMSIQKCELQLKDHWESNNLNIKCCVPVPPPVQDVSFKSIVGPNGDTLNMEITWTPGDVKGNTNYVVTLKEENINASAYSQLYENTYIGGKLL